MPPDILAQRDDSPITTAPRRAVHSVRHSIQRLSLLQLPSAAPTAAGSIGRAGRSAAAARASAKDPRCRKVRSRCGRDIARPRARCARRRSLVSAICDPPAVFGDLELDAADFLDSLAIPSVRREAVSKVLEVARASPSSRRTATPPSTILTRRLDRDRADALGRPAGAAS